MKLLLLSIKVVSKIERKILWINNYSVAQLYGSGQNDAGKMGEFGKAVYNSIGHSTVEDGYRIPKPEEQNESIHDLLFDPRAIGV